MKQVSRFKSIFFSILGVLSTGLLILSFQNCGQFEPGLQDLSENPAALMTKEEEKWSAEQSKKALENLLAEEATGVSKLSIDNTGIYPFAEYQNIGYLVTSAHNQDGSWGKSDPSAWAGEALAAKQKMAANLPSGVSLVVYTHVNTDEEIKRIKREYRDHINLKRLAIVYLYPHEKDLKPGAEFYQYRSFWSRDVLPTSLVNDGESTIFVDSKYYKDYNPDRNIATAFKGSLRKIDFPFEGGNFLATHDGKCFVVDKLATMDIPTRVFKNKYGCRKVIRLPHNQGIGHADEVVKPISAKKVITNRNDYIPILEKSGFEVIKMPQENLVPSATFVNSVTINGVVFMPSYGKGKDNRAAQVYLDAGFKKVVKIKSNKLSSLGRGSLHCITMLYPKVPFSELRESLNYQNVKVLKALGE